jgi:hypothetical protein
VDDCLSHTTLRLFAAAYLPLSFILDAHSILFNMQWDCIVRFCRLLTAICSNRCAAALLYLPRALRQERRVTALCSFLRICSLRFAGYSSWAAGRLVEQAFSSSVPAYTLLR